MYTITAIFPPKVFIEDEDGKMEQITISDFEDSPRLNAGAIKLENGKYKTTINNTDPDCVGGVCPIR